MPGWSITSTLLQPLKPHPHPSAFSTALTSASAIRGYVQRGSAFFETQPMS
jgi:hypothetical protein